MLWFEEISMCDPRAVLALSRSLIGLQIHDSHHPRTPESESLRVVFRNLFYEALLGDSNVYWSLRFLGHHRVSLNLHEMYRGIFTTFQSNLFESGTALIFFFFFLR